MIFINQKTLNGKVYTAYRDENPRIQYVECDGEVIECRLKEVWNDTNKLISLFNGK